MARLLPAPKGRFNKKELALGTKTEMEHTGDRRTATTIAKHHLQEHPRYYSRILLPAERKALRNPTRRITAEDWHDFLLPHPWTSQTSLARVKGTLTPLGTVLWNSSGHTKRHLLGAVVYPDPRVLRTLVERFGTDLARERLLRGEPLHLHMTLEAALALWKGSPIKLKEPPRGDV